MSTEKILDEKFRLKEGNVKTDPEVNRLENSLLNGGLSDENRNRRDKKIPKLFLPDSTIPRICVI